MGGYEYLRLAALILLVLPVVVLPWEGRRPPGILYAAIAFGGIAFAFFRNGIEGAILAAASGTICLILISAVIAALRSGTGRIILTGGQIKLLSSGAIWLGAAGALAMIVLTGTVLFGLGAIYRSDRFARRPDTGAIAAAAILCVGFGQLMILA
ncbi:hypothetical protein EDF56_11045 [Novosphingobium sp. PhB165]|uniref:hypothetical protein n=1 Tax=Novosphingobium sp. PhB165 TaxID=2485105 RepID=UPI0010458751|nr:hypothetical protein [Novosphingobium sp. PhB165]TCM15365.1 hypothetical protein EDF56_11045 [Novosphingobium sp. PhB165]